MSSKKPEREYVYIVAGCLDARDIEFKGIPQGIEVCPSCKGNGKRRQHYMEGASTGPCDFCRANGFVYSNTARAVPISVTNQIAVASGLRVSFRGCEVYGLDWTRP